MKIKRETLRDELEEFADICGLPGVARDDFDRHVAFILNKYSGFDY